jgi:DNA-binding transcriptional regulator YdaS (Cro superfamily)
MENELIKYFGNQNRAAKAIGVSRSHISQWLKGRRKDGSACNLSVSLANKIHQITNGKITRDYILDYHANVDAKLTRSK